MKHRSFRDLCFLWIYFYFMDYKRIYDQICERAKTENRIKGGGVYYESHHIIPTCLGGDGSVKQWATHENIVLLTAREHFLCHWLLHEMYPDNYKLARAFNLMCKLENPKQLRYRPSSRIVEYAKEVDRKTRVGNTGFWKGKKLSEETKEKIRVANIGKKQSKETLEKRHQTKVANGTYKKQGDGVRGTKWSEERRKRMSVPQKRTTCPHCFKEGGYIMKHYHFDNCKSLKI